MRTCSPVGGEGGNESCCLFVRFFHALENPLNSVEPILVESNGAFYGKNLSMLICTQFPSILLEPYKVFSG